ncbi:hypothetical protein [Bradyrhizobium cytisi]|uniref:MerR family transcriptional regulator n=1 Tax=Bradyrhizobium cytisi TaxID=515489 RepID=A0A5S4X015_9BRAD|nr:hypothetical protein [Bradyrhizobium cytisi]TYL86343.1 hypothetical protein FXB38_07650 [Bradyrhizobium cytisi]
MINDFEKKLFDMDTAAKAAGCPFPTLASWRLRGGLFKDTVTGTKHSKFFSVTEICVTRAVKVLTSAGVSTKDAIEALDYAPVHLQFFALLQGAAVSNLFGYHRDDKKGFFFDPKDHFGEILSKAGGVIIVIDLAAVVDHVRTALQIKE